MTKHLTCEALELAALSGWKRHREMAVYNLRLTLIRRVKYFGEEIDTSIYTKIRTHGLPAGRLIAPKMKTGVAPISA